MIRGDSIIYAPRRSDICLSFVLVCIIMLRLLLCDLRSGSGSEANLPSVMALQRM